MFLSDFTFNQQGTVWSIVILGAALILFVFGPKPDARKRRK